MAASKVYQEDLKHYHAKHFPGLPVPDVTIQGGHHEAEDESTRGAEAEALEEDDLGYYSDGVQRTLTDDQIAMFRHSEIQTLLRERRLREEAAGDGEPPDDPLVAQGVKRPGAAMAAGTGRYKRKKKNRKNRKLEGQKTKESDLKEAELMEHHKARMLQSLEQGDDEDEEDFTPRRIARELDEVKAAAVEVDYG